MVTLNALADQLTSSMGLEPDEGLRGDVLHASLMDAFEIGPLSSEPHPTQVIINGEVRLGSRFNNLEGLLLRRVEGFDKDSSGLSEKAGRIRRYVLTHCKMLSFSVAAMDFNPDTTDAYGESHEMSVPFYQLSRYVTIGKNSLYGGLVGGALPALINYFISGPVINAAIWFGAIVGTVAVGAYSAYSEAKDTTETSVRDRGLLGLERRIRSDLELPDYHEGLRPHNKNGPCNGRAEEFILEGKRFKKQVNMGKTHMFGLHRGLPFLPLDLWAQENEGPLFSSTIMDASPGPTIALARLAAKIDGRELGFEIAELYNHEIKATLEGSGVYTATFTFGMEKRQTRFFCE